MRLGISVALLGLALSGSLGAEELGVYSARNEALIKPLLDRFTAETGIEVRLVTGKADALLKRLQSEGKHSPADIFLTTDAGRLHRAKEAGVLQPVTSSTLEAQIPASYRDPAGYWFGLSLRARPILYAKDRVDPTTLSSYEALADPKWKGKICVRSSENIYNQSMVASLLSANGTEGTATWARGFVGNFAQPPRGGDRDQVKAAAAGRCDIAIANTYYLAAMLDSDDRTEREAAEAVSVFWPNQDGRGAHVNVSGAGVTRWTDNRDGAVRLLEFLAGEEAQRWYAEVNHEYPVRPAVPASEVLQRFGEFKPDALSLTRLGELNAESVRVMDRAGWK